MMTLGGQQGCLACNMEHIPNMTASLILILEIPASTLLIVSRLATMDDWLHTAIGRLSTRGFGAKVLAACWFDQR
jgi:hypothetical protein